MKSLPIPLGLSLICFLILGAMYDAAALDWTQNAYHDDVWSFDAAELGFGDGDEQTTLTSGRATYYFQKKFFVDELDTYSSLSLSISYDDGFVAYINGVEVARSNMPPGPPSSTTFALSSHEGGTFEDFPLPLDSLVQHLPWTPDYRLNLSIEVHQEEGSPDDISFDAELIANGTQIVIASGSSWRYFDQEGFLPVFPSDPLTLVQRPILNIPVIQTPDGAIKIQCSIIGITI